MTPPSPTASPVPPTPQARATEPPKLDPRASGPDWTDQVVDLVVDTVDKVHDRTTGPLLTVAAGAVYGVAATLVGLVVLLIVGIIISRVLSLIPGPVWIEYAAIGALLVLGGMVLWGRRLPKP